MPRIYYFLISKIFTLIFGVYYFGKLNKSYRLILILTFFAAVCEVYGYYISHFLRKTNAWLFNYYMIFEVYALIISAIWLISNKYLKLFFTSLLIIDTIYWLISIKSKTIYLFASSTMILGCIFVVFIYIILLFNSSLFSTKNIFTQPVFWLSISTILYFGCDIPLMGLHNYLFEEKPKLGNQLAAINTILDIIRYPLLGISFILLGRQQPKPLNVTSHV